MLRFQRTVRDDRCAHRIPDLKLIRMCTHWIYPALRGGVARAGIKSGNRFLKTQGADLLQKGVERIRIAPGK